MNLQSRNLSRILGFLLALTSGGVALADDSEIFTGSASSGVAPNILFILDTSGSMGSTVTTQTPYDPSVTYPGSCSSSEVYFASSRAAIPTSCTGLKFFDATYQQCQAAAPALATGAGGGPGFYTGQFVQWRNRLGVYSWTGTVNSSGPSYFDVACKADYPATGPFPTTYSGNSNSNANEWTANAAAANSYWANSGASTSYTLYSGNFINYQASNPPTVIGTRMSVVQQASTNLISSLSNVNVGLMRYSNGGTVANDGALGGMVAFPVSPLTPANKTSVINTINSYSPGGWTPLSETLYEAYLYYSGGAVHFGNTSVPFKSVAASRTGGVLSSNQYQTPVTQSCQKNFIVYLTDGLPTQDNEADALIQGLPNEATLGGACDNTAQSPYNGIDANGNPIPGGWGPGPQAGRCMAALSKYMYNVDMSNTLSDQQNVQLYTIGFGDDPALGAASAWLSKAASVGGGQSFTASDLNGLQGVLSDIVGNILVTSSTFTAPTVAVNSFNRAQTLDDLYVSVFQPSVNDHWPGNLKKYKLQSGVIVDQNAVPAVDPTTGFFKNSSQSFWSATPDGSKVTAGGAANEIPNWDTSITPSRNLYTYIGGNPGSPVDLSSSAAYAVTTTNPAITPVLLGVATPAAHDDVINYARDEDLKDENGNGITAESRHAMGDPLHSQPAIVVYGGTTAAKNVNDAVVYAATNDGYLHAVDVNAGTELWAFIPQELLPSLTDLFANNPTSPKHYALDGNIRVFRYDANGDGVIDPAAGDRVYLYVGQGRGGSNYYAFDVTSKTAPKFMWSIGPSTAGLSGIGQAWSTPTIARVRINGAVQNPQNLVLIFGGGYDTAEEGTAYVNNDGVGNSIYMVDAITGALLWSASNAGADLNLPRMDHSIPSDVRVVDLDGDGMADRLYVGDMAGQVWRFDIYNGNPAASLVTGGVIASLGTHDDIPHTVAATRRFYNAPDVALIERARSTPYFNIAIGSGYRGHPLNTTIQDRFYSIKDTSPFVKLTQAAYNAFPILHDVDLTDITGSVTPVIPAGSPGWKMLLDQPGNSWVGEKVLSSSVTFNNVILFTTYIPSGTSGGGSCTPAAGTNRIYEVSVFDGSPVANLNNQHDTNIADRYKDLAQVGIAPGVMFTFSADPNTGATDIATFVGPERVPTPPGASLRKTYWREQGVN